MLEKYLALWVLLSVLVVSFLFTIIMQLTRPRELRGDELPIARIFKKILDDIPSLLAFAITAAIILMALTNTVIPDILSKAFLLVIGFYFGTLKKS